MSHILLTVDLSDADGKERDDFTGQLKKLGFDVLSPTTTYALRFPPDDIEAEVEEDVAERMDEFGPDNWIRAAVGSAAGTTSGRVVVSYLVSDDFGEANEPRTFEIHGTR